ncbi:hypothetical protein CYMTET_36541 [Cymbomonas tetramitiformis]|uniref:UBA domain-containing protein n=1 Tax=Cymbomonas tetramitiformis TaxID=36881 RepID=A0AAE0CH04_9CHLO|nr:hypothetical protein CYMTET_36541 [Cymbomonas tetramitiformis]
MDATKELCVCRNVLQWSYVYAYFLEHNSRELELFYYVQQSLETKTETLSGLLELREEDFEEEKKRLKIQMMKKGKGEMMNPTPSKLADTKLRQEVVDLNAVLSGIRERLLKGIEKMPSSVGSSANASSSARPAGIALAQEGTGAAGHTGGILSARLTALGFSQEEAEAALAASEQDVDRAANRLLNDGAF